VEIRCAYHATPLYPQKLALTSPTSGGRSVGVIRSRTKATEFVLLPYCGTIRMFILQVARIRLELKLIIKKNKWRFEGTFRFHHQGWMVCQHRKHHFSSCLHHCSFLHGLLFELEDGGGTILRNVGSHPVGYMVLYPRRRNSSRPLMREPRILNYLRFESVKRSANHKLRSMRLKICQSSDSEGQAALQ
jgi:hypothetical protein